MLKARRLDLANLDATLGVDQDPRRHFFVLFRLSEGGSQSGSTMPDPDEPLTIRGGETLFDIEILTLNILSLSLSENVQNQIVRAMARLNLTNQTAIHFSCFYVK